LVRKILKYPLSGFSRTVVSGILNGSLLSVSLERLIRLASALDLVIDLNIKNVA
jgi:transcriptional regulator with XRE-family HTH domain